MLRPLNPVASETIRRVDFTIAVAVIAEAVKTVVVRDFWYNNVIDVEGPEISGCLSTLSSHGEFTNY